MGKDRGNQLIVVAKQEMVIDNVVFKWSFCEMSSKGFNGFDSVGMIIDS